MSDTPPTRRTDEPPTQDGAPLAGWPVVITVEEATTLQAALGELEAALDAAMRERDEARAEVERLRGAARGALEALTSCDSRYGHRCVRCDSEVDAGGHVVVGLRKALEDEK